MTPREAADLLETIARALCDAEGAFPDDPAWRGSLPTYRNGHLVSLNPMVSKWASEIVPMWASYVVHARKVAIALGLMEWDTDADFSTTPTWELTMKETAKD